MNERGGLGGDDFDRPSETDAAPRIRIDLRGLTGRFPSQLLRVIFKDDPLDLDLRCKLRIEELGVFLSRERLFLRSGARCAHKGTTYDGDADDPEQWIAARIDDSIRDLLEEDLSAVRRNLPVEHPKHYALLMDHLGFSADIAREAHVAFNDLPDEVRIAYFAISIKGIHPESYSANGGGSMEDIHGNILIAVNLILRFRELEDGESGQ